MHMRTLSESSAEFNLATTNRYTASHEPTPRWYPLGAAFRARAVLRARNYRRVSAVNRLAGFQSAGAKLRVVPMCQRFQFSLGRLLGVVTACCVIVAMVRAFWGTWVLEAAILNVLLLSSVACVALHSLPRSPRSRWTREPGYWPLHCRC